MRRSSIGPDRGRFDTAAHWCNSLPGVFYHPRFYREAEVIARRGDASKIGRVLGWQATKPFEGIVAEMVDYDLALLE